MLPKVIAPKISKIVAKIQACRRVSTLDPTDVPKELATSLAPTPNARKNAIIKAKTTIQMTAGEVGSSVDSIIFAIITTINLL
jgi:hypothetical protein